MTALGFAIKILPPLIKTVNAEMHKSNLTGFKGALAAMAKTAAESLGVPGLIMAGTLLAMAGIAGVANLISTSTNKASKTADEVNSLSNEIYKLETKARALENVTSSYTQLDNQVIKTQKDQEKMNELLDQAADKLDEEEQKAYAIYEYIRKSNCTSVEQLTEWALSNGNWSEFRRAFAIWNCIMNERKIKRV